jgi:hypothetical protein
MSKDGFDAANETTIVRLADYRKSDPAGGGERPPPPPYPAAARRPVPPMWVDARAWIGRLPRELMFAA